MKTYFDIRHLKNKIYYSQNKEDLILEAFFPDVSDGFYVDVGGYDPDYDSVTKLFYEKGWNGINIEPQPRNFSRFVKRRSRDTNLHCGVASKAGTLTMRSYKNGGLSTFSQSIKKQYEASTQADTDKYTDIEVPVRTLRDILSEYANGKTIHFMKIDVEGLEYDVLESNDWRMFRPIVLCIEANHIDNDWRPVLRAANYSMAFFDGLNEYYVDDTKETSFDYVDHVITKRGGGISAPDYEMVKGEVRHLKTCIKDRDAQIKELADERHVLQLANQTLEQQMASPKILVRKILRIMADKIVK